MHCDETPETTKLSSSTDKENSKSEVQASEEVPKPQSAASEMGLKDDKPVKENGSSSKVEAPVSAQEEERFKITIAVGPDDKGFVYHECNFTNAGHGFEEHPMCHLMVRPYQCLYCKENFINR